MTEDREQMTDDGDRQEAVCGALVKATGGICYTVGRDGKAVSFAGGIADIYHDGSVGLVFDSLPAEIATTIAELGAG